MENLESLGDFIAAQKLELAAKNLAHLIKVNEEQTSLDNIVASLEQTVIDAHGNNPADLCDMMAVQTRILDAVFHNYMDRASSPSYRDDHIGAALKAQNQMLRTALAWKRLKTDTYLKHKIVRYFAPEEKTRGTE